MVTFTWGQLTISAASLFILVSAAVWVGVKYLTKVNVDHMFSKKIEDHKSELQKLLEYNKFDFQRKMHDFSLYNSKKHEIYPKLYELYLRANGKVGDLRGLRSVPDYKKMNSAELRYTLKQLYDIDDIYLNPVISNWEDGDREQQYRELRKYIKQVEIIQARSSVIEARNQTLVQWLYFSESVAQELDRLSSCMLNYLIDIEYEDEMKGPEGIALRTAMSAKKEEINQLLIKIRDDVLRIKSFLSGAAFFILYKELMSLDELANPLKATKPRVKTERCNVCMRKFYKGYLEKHVCIVNRLLDAVEKARKNSIESVK